MRLSPRQKSFYKHRGDVWQPTTVKDADGVPTTTYAKIHSSVPMHFEKGQAQSQPSAGGRAEYDISVTKDTIHVPIGVTIDDGYWVKNTTRDRFGDTHTNTGRFWNVQGEPTTIESVGGRDASKKKVIAIQQKTAPTGVS